MAEPNRTMRVAGDGAGKAMPRKVVLNKSMVDGLRCPPGRSDVHLYDAKVPGLAHRLTARGSRAWYVIRRIKGRPQRVRLGGGELTVEQARTAAAKLNGEIAAGGDPVAERRTVRRAGTLGELWEAYRDKHIKPRGSAKTLLTDESRWDTCFAGWTARPAMGVTEADVRALHAQLGQDRGHVTANRAVQLLRRLFNWARLTPNPAGRGAVTMFKETSRARFAQPDELPALFKALDDEATNPTIRDFLYVSLLTGARRSNVAAMRAAEVNVTAATWTIPPAKSKNGQAMTLPLGEAVLAIIRPRMADPSGWIFPGHGRTGHLVEPKATWKAVLKRAGLTDLRLHDLRRTLGSFHAASGASLPVIGASLGHRNAATTQIYCEAAFGPGPGVGRHGHGGHAGGGTATGRAGGRGGGKGRRAGRVTRYNFGVRSGRRLIPVESRGRVRRGPSPPPAARGPPEFVEMVMPKRKQPGGVAPAEPQSAQLSIDDEAAVALREYRERMPQQAADVPAQPHPWTLADTPERFTKWIAWRPLRAWDVTPEPAFLVCAYRKSVGLAERFGLAAPKPPTAGADGKAYLLGLLDWVRTAPSAAAAQPAWPVPRPPRTRGEYEAAKRQHVLLHGDDGTPGQVGMARFEADKLLAMYRGNCGTRDVDPDDLVTVAGDPWLTKLYAQWQAARTALIDATDEANRFHGTPEGDWFDNSHGGWQDGQRVLTVWQLEDYARQHVAWWENPDHAQHRPPNYWNTPTEFTTEDVRRMATVAARLRVLVPRPGPEPTLREAFDYANRLAEGCQAAAAKLEPTIASTPTRPSASGTHDRATAGGDDMLSPEAARELMGCSLRHHLKTFHSPVSLCSRRYQSRAQASLTTHR